MIALPQDGQKDRQFICPCAKAYFSYAALFTHIKQKHNGKPPGQIVKPQPQNKRGRPRKSQPHLDNVKPSQIEDMLELNSNLNKANSNFHFINTPFPLKSTPGSQFKSYKAEECQTPTNNELPSEVGQETSLLQDLANNLFKINPHKVSQQTFQKFETVRLFSKQQNCDLIECICGFIDFCKQGLREQIVSQIQLLLVVLLQHVCQSRKTSDLTQLSHIHLNDYIESFFESLPIYTKRWKLQGQPILTQLYPMKILVVLYNWINSVYKTQNQSQSEYNNVSCEVDA